MIFNEIDPYCCAWLRNLYPNAIVLEKDVKNVNGSDVAGCSRVHLFAGIAGWELALDLAGWPRDLECWTGSCPCQPWSIAGRRQGHNDHRDLWPHMRRLIAERMPEHVFGEQVASDGGRQWLARVHTDLEALGYAFGAADLPAACVGSPQIRQRLFWVASASSQRRERRQGSETRSEPNGQAAGWQQGPHGPLGVHEAPTGGLASTISPRLEVRNVDQAWAERPALERDCPDFWDDYDIVPCADGKARRIEPGSFPLVDGIFASMDRLRTIETQAIKEITNHVASSKGNTREVLRMVRETIREEANRQGQESGMCVQLPAPEILLDFLLCLETACDRATDGRSIPKTLNEDQHRFLRSMWNVRRNRCPSRQRESDGQFTWESPDTLPLLSLILARHAEAYRKEARIANATTGRVNQLRAYGNSISPQVAALFIKAFMECVSTTLR